MEIEKLQKYKTQLNLLKPVIEKPICKICFNEFNPTGLSSFTGNNYLCSKCKEGIKLIFHRYIIHEVNILTLFEYKPPLSNYIFQYKESLDIELAPIFISGLSLLLSAIYLSYCVVFMPSSFSSMKRRGFNSLKEMFSSLYLRVIDDVLYKKDDIDQKTLSKKQRVEHKDFIGIKDESRLKGKNILLIDDVISTGTSIKEAIKMLKKGEPKRIRVLVLAENK